MEEQIFIVARIEGEYAILKSERDGEELFIALALLPMGTDEGTRLKYNFPDFEIIWHNTRITNKMGAACVRLSFLLKIKYLSNSLEKSGEKWYYKSVKPP